MEILQLPFTIPNYIEEKIDARIENFKKLSQSNNDEWFSELCFCILTANSQAQKAIDIQNNVKAQGFLEKSESELASIIRSFKHRFHNNKARYIVNARNFRSIKDKLAGKTGSDAREFLVSNIKGIGFKEASHFLRNVGYSDVSIIDRHILRFLKNYNFINEIPSTITKKSYLEIENILKKFQIPLDRLDLMIWYFMTGKILK